jgi:xanthine dehydrogenase accessory factor
LENVMPVRTAQPVTVLPPGSVVLATTLDHALDVEIVTAALQRPDLLAVGVIGSDTKRARFLGRLGRLGIDGEKLICPIGTPGIEGKGPAVGAVSIAAQILQIRPRQLQPQQSVVPLPRRDLLGTAAADLLRE